MRRLEGRATYGEEWAAQLDQLLATTVASGRLPGVVAVVADAAGAVYETAFGLRNAVSGEAMTLDTVFRIASMTKLATSLAALQLTEAGRLDLDAPVAELVLSFAQLQVLDGFDGDVPRLRPPRTAATVRQLFTHTSGLAYETWVPSLHRYQQLTGAPGPNTGRLIGLELPLVFDPGTAFAYGISTDWLGLVVEAVSGQRLDAYLDDHLFGPLGMTDTTGTPTADQRARCAPVHVRSGDGSWTPTAMDNASDAEFFAGGHALYSTAGDYLLLMRALLGGGEVGSTRVIRPETVDEIFANHIGAIDVPPFVSLLPAISATFDLGPGHKWGLGLLVNEQETPGLRSSGSGGWGGVFNTYFWVDRTRGVSAAIYTQTLPFYDADVVACYQDFERAIYT